MNRPISIRWKLYWLVFAANLIVYLLMILWSLPKISQMAGGSPAFDLRPAGYSPDEARSFLAALGEVGTDFYLNVQQPLDTVFPALLAITLLGALTGLKKGGWGWIFAGFGLAGSLFDYLENAKVHEMLRAGPDNLTAALVNKASNWTVLKSISHSVAFSGLLLFAILAICMAFSNRRLKQ